MKIRFVSAVLSCLGAIALMPSTASAAVWTSFPVAKITGFTTTFAHTTDGRFVLGANSSVFVQNTFGAAAKSTIPSGGVTYDPSFVAIKDATTALLGAGGFGGASGMYVFDPSSSSTAVLSTAIASLQNYTAAYWKHPTSGREGWLIGGGNGASGAHNVTFVSLDGSKVGAITEALCTYSSGITVDGAGNLFTALYELDNAPNAADAEKVLKFTADQVDAAVAAVIAGTPAPVARSASQVVFKFDSAASIAVDSLGRIWAAGFKTSALQCYDPATGVTKRFTPDHAKIVGAAGPTSYQVQCFRNNSTDYVAFIANDLFTTANTDIIYGYKPVSELLMPAVQFTSTSQTVAESAGSITISVRVNIAPTAKLTVPITLSGTAAKGTDYNVPTSIAFNAGETTKSITLSIIDDALDEPIDNETVVLKLGKPSLSTYALPVDGKEQVTVTITDNDFKPQFNAQTLANARVGSAFTQILAMTTNPLPVTFKAYGLPAGMSINATTGELIGTPKTPGEYDQIWITATNSAGTTTSMAFTLVVEDFSAMAKGSFVALADRSGTATDGLGARIDLNVTSTACYTGNVTIGKSSYPFTGTLNTASGITGSTSFKRGTTTVPFTFAINATTGAVTGSITNGGGFTGWRAAGATSVAGVHNFSASIAGGGSASVPEGASYGSAKVLAAGTATISGRTADGTSFSSASPLGSGGELLVYQSLYIAPGSFIGTLAIANDLAHTLSGSLSWSKPAQTTGTVYRSGWSPVINLTAKGGKYRPAIGSTLAMNVPASATNNARVFLQDGGIEAVATNPSKVPFRLSAPAVVAIASPNTLTITNSTGAFSGSVKLGTKTFAVQGLIVPDASTPDPYDGEGNGYFLLPTSVANVTRSGLVVVEPTP